MRSLSSVLFCLLGFSIFLSSPEAFSNNPWGFNYRGYLTRLERELSENEILDYAQAYLDKAEEYKKTQPESAGRFPHTNSDSTMEKSFDEFLYIYLDAPCIWYLTPVQAFSVLADRLRYSPEQITNQAFERLFKLRKNNYGSDFEVEGDKFALVDRRITLIFQYGVPFEKFEKAEIFKLFSLVAKYASARELKTLKTFILNSAAERGGSFRAWDGIFGGEVNGVMHHSLYSGGKRTAFVETWARQAMAKIVKRSYKKRKTRPELLKLLKEDTSVLKMLAPYEPELVEKIHKELLIK